jgi:methionyl-tRNA synthetase
MPEKNSFYITTPIYYVNDSPHIGHAYTTLACDVMARFKRLDGFDVFFLTGTDEHGQKVEKSAAAAGIDPQTFTDQVSQNFRALTAAMNFSQDQFIRTTEKRHKEACQELWRRLSDNGHIYLGKYAGWYAVRDEAFYDESELIISQNGEKIAPTGAEVEWLEEPSYFFDLSKWQERLLQFYEENPDFIAPRSRRNEVISFVSAGLHDLSISRTSFSWGVPVPNNADHIMYVWLDALTNYMTATGFPDENNDNYRKFWPADLHMVGKDILRFHAVYWPAFLMGAGLDPPKRIFAHGWWTNEGQKISKSLGNVIDPLAIKEQYGLDQVRFFLLREVPFGNDGDFSHESIVNRMNSELANDLGNLVQRSLSMIQRYFGGHIPQAGALNEEDQVLLSNSIDLLSEVREYIDQQAFNQALEAIWVVVRSSNVFVDRQAPWKSIKIDKERAGTVLWVLVQVIRRLGLILLPFIPGSAHLILDQLKIAKQERDFTYFSENKNSFGLDEPLPDPQGIFPKYEVNS